MFRGSEGWTKVRGSAADSQLLVERQDATVDQLGVGLDLGLVALAQRFRGQAARERLLLVDGHLLAVDAEGRRETSRLCALLLTSAMKPPAAVQRSPSTRLLAGQAQLQGGLGVAALAAARGERGQASGERGLDLVVGGVGDLVLQLVWVVRRGRRARARRSSCVRTRSAGSGPPGTRCRRARRPRRRARTARSGARGPAHRSGSSASFSSERPSWGSVALAFAASRIVGERSALIAISSTSTPFGTPGPRISSGTRIASS